MIRYVPRLATVDLSNSGAGQDLCLKLSEAQTRAICSITSLYREMRVLGDWEKKRKEYQVSETKSYQTRKIKI